MKIFSVIIMCLLLFVVFAFPVLGACGDVLWSDDAETGVPGDQGWSGGTYSSTQALDGTQSLSLPGVSVHNAPAGLGANYTAIMYYYNDNNALTGYNTVCLAETTGTGCWGGPGIGSGMGGRQQNDPKYCIWDGRGNLPNSLITRQGIGAGWVQFKWVVIDTTYRELWINGTLEDNGSIATITNYKVIQAGDNGGNTPYLDNMTFYDISEPSECPVLTSTLNISIFSPADGLHINDDMTVVFNTSNINNGTCTLLVDGAVKDAETGINSTESNYSLTYSSVTEGNRSWYVSCYDAGSAVRAIPNSVTTIKGVQHGNATNLTAQDGSYLHIDEVTGTPGIDVRFNWTMQLDEPQQGNFYLNYVGGSSHFFIVQGWNGTAWEEQGNFSYTGSPYWANFSSTPPRDRFSVDGQVSIRFLHEAAGNINHDLYVDYAEIVFVDGSSSVDSDHRHVIVDLTNPVINNVKPVSGENINTANYGLDIRYSDVYLSQTETNITCGQAQIYYNKTTELSQSFNVTNTTSFSGIESSCLLQMRAADDHTSLIIADYSVLPSKDNLLFNTDKGAAIRVTSKDAALSSFSKIVDRYTFGYEYGSTSTSWAYSVSSSWPLLVNDLRDYPAFVALDPDGFGGHWIDFRNKDIKSWEVTKTGLNAYSVSITFNKGVDKASFQSVGGLNVIEKNITFNVDTVAPRVYVGPRENRTGTGVSYDFEFNVTDASSSTGNFYTNETGSWALEYSYTPSNGSQKDYTHVFTAGGLIEWGFCATDNFSLTACDENFTIFINASVPVITITAAPENYTTISNSVTVSATVTQSAPLPDTLIFYTTQGDGSTLQQVSSLSWVNGESNDFDMYMLEGFYTYAFSANDTLGHVAWSENRTINVTASNYSGIFSGSACPNDSVQSVMMFAFLFFMLITIYIVVLMFKFPYIIETAIGLAMLFFAFPVINCNMFLGAAVMVFGLGIITKSVFDAMG